MRITKRQLRRIIKEEKTRLIAEEYGMGQDITADMQSLMDYLRGAEERAAYISTASRADVAYGENAGGREAEDLAMALERIYEAFGFEPSDIFK
jgi:hypothetical protein